MINNSFRVIALILLVFYSGSVSQSPQYESTGEEANIIDSFGRVTDNYLNGTIALFLQEITKRGKGTKGIVVNYGPVREVAARKRVIDQYLTFRRSDRTLSFDPALITFIRGGNVSELRTDLWVVTEGADEPSIAPEAFIAGEFGNVTSAGAKPIIKNFFLEFEKLKTHQAFIINYGTNAQIKQREKWFTIGTTVLGRHIDSPRITFVRGGRKSGVRTVMWLLPPGASNPHP